MSEICWRVVLVTEAFEGIRIKRGGKEIFSGTVPRGFAYHLFLGDRVYCKIGNVWTKKFEVVTKYNKPCLRWGKRGHDKLKYIEIGGDNE